MKRKKQEVVYKDTFKFKCFPEYKYTPAQKARFVLFQGRIEHWRAAINYADRFDNPNKINLVYMIGYSDKMRAAILKTKNNVVVLAAKISTELLQVYDEYWGLIDKLKTYGYADDDGNLSQRYIEARRSDYEFGEGKDKVIDRAIAQYREEDRIIQAYEAIKPEINKCYERFTIIDKLHPEKTIAHKDIDRIIKRYFPFGREQCRISDMAYKSMALIDKAVKCGMDGEDGAKLLKIPNDADALEILRKNIKRCDMYANVELRKSGCVDLQKLFEKMKYPPYGWGRDAHSAYCFASAMRNHIDGYWIWDSLAAFPSKESMPIAIPVIVKGIKDRFHEKVLFNESGWHLCDRIAYMFNVEPIYPLTDTLRNVRKAIEKHTRFPVAMIDVRINSILAGEESALIDSDNVKELTKYYTWDRCKEIREKYESINEDTVSLMQEKFPGITDETLLLCTTECSGWLWKRMTFYETVYNKYNGFTMEDVVKGTYREKSKQNISMLFGEMEGA